jgi:transcription-repair coupling factor (superfamily II helicase)
MSAIRQYSALGSGFKIAMRDLEIRGAGNILGAQQSGHITAVGFDLYCQLLARSIRSLKGEKEPPLIQVQTQFDFLASHSGETGIELDRRIIPKPPAPAFDIDVPRDEGVPAYVPEKEKKRARSPHDARGGDGKAAAFIPLDYIREPSQRVEAYRKLMQAGSKEELGRFREELHDRFGPPPPAVDLMLQAAELRFLAAQRKISSIEVTEGKIKITRNGDLITVSGQFPRLTKKDARGRLNEIRKLLLSIA